MGFERAKNEVLGTECPRIIRGGQADCLFGGVAHAKFQAVFLDGVQVGPARNHTDFVPGGSQSNSKIATDRTRAIDAKLHGEFLHSVL